MVKRRSTCNSLWYRTPHAILAVVLVNCGQGFGEPAAVNQSAVLLAWKTLVRPVSPARLASWKGEACTGSTSSWVGIACMGNQVISLNLKGAGLLGTLSAPLFQLPALAFLDLSDNLLTGPLPQLDSTSPALSFIQLQNNNLTGTLPASWGVPPAFPNLVNLYLANNSLAGTFPASWVGSGAFPNLAYMDLAFNKLKGALPTPADPSLPGNHLGNQYGLVPQKEGFGLCGVIPALFGVNLQGIGRISDRTRVDVTGEPHARDVSFCPCPGPGNAAEEEAILRAFVSSVPALLKDPRYAAWLTTPMCAPYGPPWAGATCAEDGYVQALRFANLDMEQPLPPDFGKLQRLQKLEFLSTELFGTLPDAWKGMSGLCNLKIDNSGDLTGPLPPSWAALNVRNLSLTNNTLTGQLPAAWADGMPYLQNLNLYNNALLGTLPEAWFEPSAFPSLQLLDVSSNPKMTGQIPPITGGNLQARGVIVVSGGGASGGFCGGSDKFNVRTYQGANANYLTSKPCPPPPETSRGVSTLAKALIIGAAVGVAILGLLVSWMLSSAERAPPVFTGAQDDLEKQYGMDLPTKHGANGHSKGGSLLDSSQGTGTMTGTASEEGTGDMLPSLPDSSTRKRAMANLDRILSWSVGDIDLLDLELTLDDAGKPKVLGRGASGEVLLAKWRSAPVAVKRLLDVDVDQMGLHALEFRQEAELLRSLRHPNIVLFLGACMEPDQMVIVTEFCSGGSLAKAIATDTLSGDRRLGWHGRGKPIAIGIARGLAYLHSRKVIHHDIKSANVLLDGTKTLAKIADLGVSRIVAGTHATATVRGTLAYMAPECLKYGELTSFAVDIFSFGVLLHEIITGEPPDSRRGALREPRVPGESPQEIVDLYKACMDYNPDARPTAAGVVDALETAAAVRTVKSGPASLLMGPTSPRAEPAKALSDSRASA